MSFNDFTIAIVGRNDYRIHFWGMTESEALNRMKNVDLSEKKKKGDNYELLLRKKIFIVISNDTPKAVTKQQRHHKKSREKRIEKGKTYY